MTDERVIEYEVDGKQYICEEGAIAALLDASVCYISASDKNVTVFVSSNDVFHWGTADGEDLPFKELESLYRAWKADSKWGVTKWACKQRGMRPQWCLMQNMMKDGAWDEAMETLPKRDDEGTFTNPIIERYRYTPEQPNAE